MPFSINLLCLPGIVQARRLDDIRRVATLGYDAVEVPVLSGEPTHYARLGRELDHISLPRTTTSIVPSPDANALSADPEIRGRGVAHLDWALDCATALGAESVGGPCTRRSAVSRDRGQARMIFATEPRRITGRPSAELDAAARVWRPLIFDHDTRFAESLAYPRSIWEETLP